MSDEIKQALLDGTATIQTKLEILAENLLNTPYTESNKLTKTATKNDDYTATDYYATLETGKNYVFKCKTDGTFGNLNTFQTQCFLLLNKEYATILGMGSKDGYVFTVPVSGNYYLRYDVNINGETHSFWDFEIREEQPTLTEENSVVSWNHEEFRYVKDQGFIGQFVARQVDGVVKNISDDFSITDKEFILHMGVKIEDNTTWYSLGNFMVTKVTDDEVNDKTSFEAMDYTKKFNKTYEDTIEYPCTALDLVKNICEQCGVELGSEIFKHNDWVITGNPFIDNQSCRDVLKEIGKLAYSWIRIGWDNKLYIDFNNPFNTELDLDNVVDEYNIITNHEYYSLKTQKEKFGPVNRVIIGYSQIEGERTKVEDTESIETNGLCEITIFDNPFVYTQELREQAIIGAEDLLGLKYMPINTLTVGHPWLKGDDLVKTIDMENNAHFTLPFDRTIQYFGHIKTLLDAGAMTKTNTEYAYNGGMDTRIRKTEIAVDKINGQITEVIYEQTETTEKLNEVVSTVDGMKQTVSNVETTVNDITTVTQTSISDNLLLIDDALENNVIQYAVNGKCVQETSEQSRNIAGLSKSTFNNANNDVNYSLADYNKVNVYGSPNSDWESVSFYIYPKEIGKYSFHYKLESKTDNLTRGLMNVAKFNKSGTRLKVLDLTIDNVGYGRSANFEVDDISDDVYYTVGCYLSTASEDYDKGAYCSITYSEIYLAKEDSFSSYVPFTPDSPSPLFPSEIYTIPSNHNLFNYNNVSRFYVPSNSGASIEIIENGLRIRINDLSKGRGCGYLLEKPESMLGKTYTLSYVAEQSGKSTPFAHLYWWDGTKNGSMITYIPSDRTSRSFTLPNSFPDGITGIMIYLYANQEDGNAVGDYVDYKDLMIHEGSGVPDFIPYGSWIGIKRTGKNMYNKDDVIIGDYSLLDDGSIAGSNIKHVISSHLIPVKSGNTYTISAKSSSTSGNYNRLKILLYDSKGYAVNTLDLWGGEPLSLFTSTIQIPENVKSVRIQYRHDANLSDLQFEENSENTDYDEFNGANIFIDINKKNLLETPYTISNKLTMTATRDDYYIQLNYYAKLKSGRKYIFKCETDGEWGHASGSDTVECYLMKDNAFDYVINITSKNYIFTPNQDGDFYLRVDINKNNKTYSFWNFEIYDVTETPDDYYELNSVGNVYDSILIVDNQINFTKRIGKLVLNGSENWSISPTSGGNNYFSLDLSDVIKTPVNNDTKPDILCSHYNVVTSNEVYNDNNGISVKSTGELVIYDNRYTSSTSLDDFKEQLSKDNVVVYYVAINQQLINLGEQQIPLITGINHIILQDSITTITGIEYFRNTTLSTNYVVQQQLDLTNGNLSDVSDRVQQNQSSINDTNTRLDNDYYNKEQVDQIKTNTDQEIVQIKNQVEVSTTSTNYQISILEEQISKGVTSVTTETGYTFDKEGLKIAKSDSEMSSLLDNDGLAVKRNQTEVLTVRSSGVETENLKVRTFLHAGKHTRIQDYKDGTGFFYIGGDE